MEEKSLTELVVHLVMQLSVIIAFAKLAGELTERYLNQPSVLGELAIGIVIGPYALGSLLHIPGLGPLFPVPHGAEAGVPISPELYSIAQIAVILLLFIAGLETDLEQFLRYARPATIVALGGVILPFLFGDLLTVWMGFADSFMHPTALFMGAALTATSVGITARVLSDMGRLNTEEGVTILAGAVVDDVLGILILAVVVSVASTGAVSAGKIALIGLKALGFWIALLAVGLLTADKIARFLKKLSSAGAWLAVAVGICFFFSALSEMFGLAMIIGAYAVGLAFSKTELKEELIEQLMGVYYVFIPIFFVVMGMMVNVGATLHALGFGLLITLAAIVGKVVGCGLPALTVGFNPLGAYRIGIGMLPRGEVALIVAGIAIARGAIPQEMYGVAILMTMVTTLMAPIFLVPAFRNPRSGLRRAAAPVEGGRS